MATFDTGNAAWDQGLSSLGNALFPDPGRVAQGYLYGSEARKAQLEGNQLIGQQNAGNRLILMGQNASGQGPAPAPPTFYTPSNVPGAAPILASPANLPGVGAPASTASLSSAIMPTQGQVVQAAANTSGTVQQYTTGTPPAASSPAPGAGAPTAPNTTGSDGSPPTNDYGSGPIHPASTNPTPGQGGTLQAPAAGPNGSIAPTPFNALNFMIMSLHAGRDAASSMAIVRAYLGQLLNQNQISEGEYRRQLASVGEPGPYTTTISDAGATLRTRIAEAGATHRTELVEAGAKERLGMGVQPVVDPNNPNKVTYLPLSQMQGPGGTPSYNPATAPESAKISTYLDPKSGAFVTTSAADAAARGLIQPAGSSDQLNARTVEQIRNEPDPVKRQAMTDQLIATTLRGQVIPPEQQAKQKQDDYADLQAAYPVPKQGWLEKGAQISAPVALDPDAAAAVAQRVIDLRRTPGPNQVAYLQDAGQVYRAAIKSLQDEGALSKPDDINNGRRALRKEFLTGGAIADPRTDMAADLSKKGFPVTPHMTIHLVKQPAAVTPGGGSLGAAVTTAQPTVEGSPVTNAAPAGPTPQPGPQYGSAAGAATPNAPATSSTPEGPVQTGSPTAPAAPQPRPPVGRGLRNPTEPGRPLSEILPSGIPPEAFTGAPAQSAPVATPSAAPVAPAQIYGGSSTVPAGRPIYGATAPTPAGQRPTAFLPQGAFIQPAPGAAEGSTGVIGQTGQRYIVRGGNAYVQ